MLAFGSLMTRHALHSSAWTRPMGRQHGTLRVLTATRSKSPPLWMTKWNVRGHPMQKKLYHSSGYGHGYGYGYGNGNGNGMSSETVMYGLIGANVVVYMLWQGADTNAKRSRMIQHFTTSESHLRHGAWHTLLTCTFSHMTTGHLALNMIGLYFFGGTLCGVLGAQRFLSLYLGSGVFSSLAAVAEQMHAKKFSFNLGASGAVNALTAMTVLCYPHATFLIFGILPMPAYLAGTLFIGKDFYAWWQGVNDGVGHFAHLGGAFYGAGYYFYLKRAMRAASTRGRRW